MPRLLFSFFLLTIFTIFAPLTHCGKAVLSGGELEATNAAVYSAFIELSTAKTGGQYIGVLTSGNTWETAETVATPIARRLQKTYGATKAEFLPLHLNNGNSCTDPAFVEKIKQMTGMYFSGGDTDLYVNCFYKSGQPTEALKTMQEMYRADKLAIMGSSAGTLILQTTPMLKVYDSWQSLTYGSSY